MYIKQEIFRYMVLLNVRSLPYNFESDFYKILFRVFLKLASNNDDTTGYAKTYSEYENPRNHNA